MPGALDAAARVGAFLTFLLGLHYGKAGLDGIRKRRMSYMALQTWEHGKLIHVEGETALYLGWFFLIVSLPCILIPALGAIIQLLRTIEGLNIFH